jgi:hypothetical protein
MRQQRNQTNNNIPANKNPVTTSPNENNSHTVVTILNGATASPNK